MIAQDSSYIVRFLVRLVFYSACAQMNMINIDKERMNATIIDQVLLVWLFASTLEKWEQ